VLVYLENVRSVVRVSHAELTVQLRVQCRLNRSHSLEHVAVGTTWRARRGTCARPVSFLGSTTEI